MSAQPVSGARSSYGLQRASEFEDEAKRCFDPSQFVESEVTNAVAKSRRVDRGGLLSEHACDASANFYIRPESRSVS